MGANRQRIDALEREVDQLHIVISRLHDRLAALEPPAAAPVVRPLSLGDRVRSEFHDRWGWLLEAVR
jgi:hypothetical protein